MKHYKIKLPVKGKATGRINIPAHHMRVAGFEENENVVIESKLGEIVIRRASC